MNNEHMRMFCPLFSIWSPLKVKLRRCIDVRNQLVILYCLHSKLHAWIDELGGRGMLNVKLF